MTLQTFIRSSLLCSFGMCIGIAAVPTQAPRSNAARDPVALDSEARAAQDLAEMVLWFNRQDWVVALRKSMPRGVTVSMDAKPYDAEGWSEVELRENHAPGSGFDPDVSPIVGFFRVSRQDRRIEWMEPISGEYQPLKGFLKARGLLKAR